MSSPAEAQPDKRRPGRPRKQVETKVVDEPEEPVVERVRFPSDERIGQSVDPTWIRIGFMDGRQYRIENGVIVERTQ